MKKNCDNSSLIFFFFDLVWDVFENPLWKCKHATNLSPSVKWSVVSETFNPLPDTPILGSSNSAAIKDMI